MTHPHAWQDHAACTTTDPEVFFGDRANTRSSRVALGICAGCPVRTPCLREAIDQERDYESLVHVYGIRGGLTADQRRQLLKYGGAA